MFQVGKSLITNEERQDGDDTSLYNMVTIKKGNQVGSIIQINLLGSKGFVFRYRRVI